MRNINTRKRGWHDDISLADASGYEMNFPIGTSSLLKKVSDPLEGVTNKPEAGHPERVRHLFQQPAVAFPLEKIEGAFECPIRFVLPLPEPLVKSVTL